VRLEGECCSGSSAEVVRCSIHARQQSRSLTSYVVWHAMCWGFACENCCSSSRAEVVWCSIRGCGTHQQSRSLIGCAGGCVELQQQQQQRGGGVQQQQQRRRSPSAPAAAAPVPTSTANP
jgi:hypothetical protein